MEIVFQTIRIIDYENNAVYVRDTPETFSDYVRTLIAYINENASIREYHTRSTNTEVISCILDVVKNQIDVNFVTDKMNFIANRLLLKEQEAQTSVARMNTNVQKGSLIQALMYNEEKDEHIYLLAKVEHTDFVDDEDFSFKSGFSKDMKKLWKSCTFIIDDLAAPVFSAKVYSNTVAKYWYDNFLELDQVVSDEVNTDKAFRAIDSTLNRNVKGIAPRDHALIRNAMIAYFKSNDYIDYDTMIQNTLENYHPVELEQEKMEKVLERIRELPEKYKFDKQFSTVPSVINARIKKVYDVCRGVQLRITDAIDDFDETIKAYRDNDGNRYIQIKTDNDLTFRRFSNQ
ncbi:hypothetical protein DW757_13320 [Clostridium sp. AM29-11AC]|nr:hypothetical protein [Clostridium sp. AM29-11AC]RHT55675.1 hypothetical protein DW757_13320 [Clostridium sp. AM29-11AC]